jgi:hypothetical protein
VHVKSLSDIVGSVGVASFIVFLSVGIILSDDIWFMTVLNLLYQSFISDLNKDINEIQYYFDKQTLVHIIYVYFIIPVILQLLSSIRFIIAYFVSNCSILHVQ